MRNAQPRKCIERGEKCAVARRPNPYKSIQIVGRQSRAPVDWIPAKKNVKYPAIKKDGAKALSAVFIPDDTNGSPLNRASRRKKHIFAVAVRSKTSNHGTKKYNRMSGQFSDSPICDGVSHFNNPDAATASNPPTKAVGAEIAR